MYNNVQYSDTDDNTDDKDDNANDDNDNKVDGDDNENNENYSSNYGDIKVTDEKGIASVVYY